MTGERAALLSRGLRLEYFTVGWNIVEGLIAALVIVVFLLREAREAWEGEEAD